MHKNLVLIYVLFYLFHTISCQGESLIASAPTTSSVFSPTLNKTDVCLRDLDISNRAMALIQVKPIKRTDLQKKQYPRVFCFVNTISIYHKTRAYAVAATWGQRCHKLVFFSNETDTITIPTGSTTLSFPCIAMDVIADHNHLWQKHKATLKYIYEHYRNDYDWFYKADDDAYVVVENLHQYLRRPEVLQKYLKEPMQFGHRFSLPQELIQYYIVNNALEKEFYRRWKHWIFNSGGPGYAMNRLYLDKIIEILPDFRCLSDRRSRMLPDDASISFCMMWHNIYPYDTRDYKGRERWHADKPRGAYWTNPNQPKYWYVQYHEGIGGVRWKDEGLAPDSVAFHYASPPLMFFIERKLYWCRTSFPDINEFNQYYELSITERVMTFEPMPKKKDKIW